MPSLDVAARLDEGQSAVDTIAEYVWACQLLGFSHPDLTRYRDQVHDWYAAEDGLDLRVLDAECASLAAAAAAAEQAERLQGSHFQDLSQAWQGAGARASTGFLDRHARCAAQVATGIRGAAATLGRLRDNLWQAVDAKAAAAIQIEGRQAGQRGTWLAAARTVSTGAGDRSAASELIDAQVKPFVANDIGGEWLTAMRGMTRAVADAYAQALTALRAEVSPMFGIPGELGPVWLPSTPESRHPALALAADTADRSSVAGARGGFTAPVAPVGMPPVEMAAGAPPVGPPVGPEPMVAAGAPSESAAPAFASPAGLGQGLGGGGLPGLGGMPDIGSGLTGTGQSLADLLGGLIGSSADDLPEDIGGLEDEDIDPGADDDAHDEAEDDTNDDSDETAADEDEDEDTAEGQPAGQEDPGVEVTESQPDPLPAATEVPESVAPPPTVPGPAAEPLAAPAGDTPCAIAADELPQAGP
ncbi:hypothetical protein [Mycolicibacterium lutetiense]|uniref:Uncharacterized protein n=1 Tax=Mycolicibacterium lutetiense TaxID=1641992 RepID=A0ABS4ZWJ9_9MYCO|nr:hypothetical protein [Mycolicibacterium lutetiense]MBP2453891.1 hypothetical protein [Mycolicibacterium lutetiense]